jgi:hypothetical protein
MAKKEVIISSAINIAGTSIVTVATIETDSRFGRRSAAVNGSIRPEGVIITTPTSRRAFRMTGEEIDPEELVREFPAVAERPGKI